MREGAIQKLNGIAAQVGLDKLPVKTAWKAVQRLIKKVQARTTDAPTTARLFDTAKEWVDNWGHLDGTLAPPPPQGSKAPPGDDATLVPKHRVLLPNFRLQSRAFMVTYNSKQFTKETWCALRAFTQTTAQRLGATAWAACLEESLNAKHFPSGRITSKTCPSPQFHGHAYYFWDGAERVRLHNTNDFVFAGVRPRVDVCAARNPATFKSAALHGLWYVFVRKKGAVAEATNYLPWQAYLPKKEWLVSLWAQRKLDHDDFERLSAHFREGHAARMQELAAVRRTEMACAVREHIRLEAARADTTTLLSFRRFAEVDQFLTCFEPKTFLLRRPILVIVGWASPCWLRMSSVAWVSCSA